MSKPLDAKQSPAIPFAAVGTIMYTDIVYRGGMPRGMSPLAIVEAIRRHQDFTHSAIHAHGGELSQFIGDATVAYWLDGRCASNHAASAFSAARQMLEGLPAMLAQQSGLEYDLRVTLGSGEMAGEYFGPIKQFQIMGLGRAVADRLARSPPSVGSFVRMSQYTASLLDGTTGLADCGVIARDFLPDLQILEWR